MIHTVIYSIYLVCGCVRVCVLSMYSCLHKFTLGGQVPSHSIITCIYENECLKLLIVCFYALADSLVCSLMLLDLENQIHHMAAGNLLSALSQSL